MWGETDVPAPKKPKAKEPAEKRKLTPAQRLFADYVIEGKAKNEAYRLAYPQSSLSPGPLSVEAYRTANLPHVADYIAEALSERRKEVLLTRDKKRQILGSIALDTRAPRSARILAVKTDNEMTGDNAPVRVEGEITLGLIFRSLAHTTGIPAPQEVHEIGEAKDVPALPAAPVPETPEEADPLPLPAIERRA